MSWTITKKADGHAGGQQVNSADFRVTYLAQGTPGSDTAVDAAGAMALTGVPRLGDSYGTSHASATCVSIAPRCLGNGWEWEIDCAYASTRGNSTIPGDGSADQDSDNFVGGGYPDGYDPTDPNNGLTVVVDDDGVTRRLCADEDPRRLPWQFEMGTQTTLRERYRLKAVDNSGNVGAEADTTSNTAGMPFSGAVMEEQNLPVFQLSKSVPDGFITPAQAMLYEGSTNEAAIKIAGGTLVARQGLITGLRLRRAWFGPRFTAYWEIALSIMIFDTVERSDIWVLQRGYQELVGGVLTDIKAGLRPITTPALLDVNGAKTTTPYYKKFARSNSRSWAPLKLPKRV